MLPRQEHRTGVPHAKDSAMLMGNPSYQTLGAIVKEAFFIAARTFSAGSHPVKVTFLRFRAVASASSDSRKGPSPTTNSGILFRSFPQAARRVETPFSDESRPTKRAKSPGFSRSPGSGKTKLGLTWILLDGRPPSTNLRRANSLRATYPSTCSLQVAR